MKQHTIKEYRRLWTNFEQEQNIEVVLKLSIDKIIIKFLDNNIHFKLTSLLDDKHQSDERAIQFIEYWIDFVQVAMVFTYSTKFFTTIFD